jgi:hypothetical protein
MYSRLLTDGSRTFNKFLPAWFQIVTDKHNYNSVLMLSQQSFYVLGFYWLGETD